MSSDDGVDMIINATYKRYIFSVISLVYQKLVALRYVTMSPTESTKPALQLN